MVALTIALITKWAICAWRFRAPLDAEDSGDSLTALLHAGVALVDELRVIVCSCGSSILDWLGWCGIRGSMDRTLQMMGLPRWRLRTQWRVRSSVLSQRSIRRWYRARRSLILRD